MNLRKKKANISVIIPYYNMGKYIDSLLESLDKQTYEDFGIILVNDGSNDEFSLEKLKHIEKSRPDIKVIHQDNKGLPGARNTGIKEARGKYICCIDPDDKYHSSYLEKGCTYLDKNQSTGIINSWVKTFGETNSIIELNESRLPSMLIRNNIHVASIFRRELWEEVMGYDEKMINGYEDWEFWINCLSHGTKVYTIEEPLFYYRVTKGSMLRTLREDPIKIEGNLNYIYTKHKQAYSKYLVEVLSGKDREIQYLNNIIKESRKNNTK